MYRLIIVLCLLLAYLLIGYLYFWGIAFCLVAVLITIFKKEKLDLSDTIVGKTKILETYKLLWKILHLPTIQKFTIVMLTYEVITILLFRSNIYIQFILN